VVKINVYGATIRPNIFVLSFLWFFNLFFLLLSSYSSLLIFKLFKLFLSLFIYHIMSPDPVLPIAASQILSANNIKKKPRRKYNVPRPSHRNAAGVINEKTPRILPVWQKIRQSIPQLI
jgi:hypothetical protein